MSLILSITNDSEFLEKKQKMFNKMRYSNINASSTEESIKVLKKIMR